MRERVIPDHVAMLLHFQSNVGPLPNVAPHHEERGKYVMSRQNIQEVKRVWIVRPIVECECDLPRPARQAVKSSAKPLPRRRHGLMSGSNGGGRSDNRKREHWN